MPPRPAFDPPYACADCGRTHSTRAAAAYVCMSPTSRADRAQAAEAVHGDDADGDAPDTE